MTQQQAVPIRTQHPILNDLVGGIELSASAIEKREDATALGDFARMLANAEYWLSFDMANFEPLLEKSPSPLRELGVAVLLRFSEQMLGELTVEDLEQAKKVVIPLLAVDLAPGVEHGLDTLVRAVKTRDGIEALKAEGFIEHSGGKGTSVHALRAFGSGNILIDGNTPAEKRPAVELGKPVKLKATDERGRALDPPDIESRISAPVFIKDTDGERTAIFFVPGEYHLRVPGKASGDRKIVAV
jgi:hypothetical protein